MKIVCGLFLCYVFAIFITSCARTDENRNNYQFSKFSTPAAGATPFKVNMAEKKIVLRTAGSESVNATVSYSPDAEYRIYTLTAESTFDINDESLHFVAAQLVEQFYVTGKSLAPTKDAEKKRNELGAFTCWQITQMSQKFCIAPSQTDAQVFSEAIFYAR